MFLLCDDCGAVQETPMAGAAISELQQSINSLGFVTQQNPLLEVHGRCASCVAL